MSNFDFLKDFDEKLYRLGIRVEKEVEVSPSGVLAESTRFLQHFLDQLLVKIGLKFNSRKDYYDQLDAVYRKNLIDYKYKNTIYSAYMLRNKLHADIDEIEKDEQYIALQLYEKLYVIAKKYYRDFNEGYDSYEGLPPFKPIVLDTTDDEIELLKVPDFSDIVDISYDYCVICGEPNHSNYSLCCHKCNRVMDNANNFISIRNSFGKDAKFTKEDLIDYGIPEGYANQLIHTLSIENMFKVKGRFISFNNLYMDEYLTKVDRYIAICELITKFCEDEILPSEIKKTREYVLGSRRQNPYYQFFKVIDHEVINKFERDLLTTENIWESIEFTTITPKQLETWYLKNLKNHNKGIINDSFVIFNDLLMEDYIALKREGLSEKDIKSELNVSNAIYEFWTRLRDDFEDELAKIKKELVLNALNDGKTGPEAIEIAGITQREFDNILNSASYNDDEYALKINEEMESRKSRFVIYLESNSLKSACKFAKITEDDFYRFYESSKLNSLFYLEATRILMQKYLDERRKGKTKKESIESMDFREKYVDQWMDRHFGIYGKFNDDNLKVTVDLILRGFKWNKSKEEICRMAEVKEETIDWYLNVGEKGSEIFKPLSDYYEAEIIPQKLDKFLKANEHKSMRKALESSDLSEKELDYYYELGKSGDERFVAFYNEFLDIKKGTYVYNMDKRNSHDIAMRESRLTHEEYSEYKDDLDNLLMKIKINIVLVEITNNKTSAVAAKKAKISVDEIYDWYFKGKDGDEEFEGFYKIFHGNYVRPAINAIQKGLDNNLSHLDYMIRHNKDKFTKKDVEIWVKNGLLDNKVLTLNVGKKDKEDKKKSDYNPNEMLKEMGVEDYEKISTRKNSSSSTILNKDDYDVEELKKQILKK